MVTVDKFKRGASRLIIISEGGTFISVPNEGVNKSIANKVKPGSNVKALEDKDDRIYQITYGPQAEILYSRLE
jgi:hypothetical protein